MYIKGSFLIFLNAIIYYILKCTFCVYNDVTSMLQYVVPQWDQHSRLTVSCHLPHSQTSRCNLANAGNLSCPEQTKT